jgi:hypothetical protein
MPKIADGMSISSQLQPGYWVSPAALAPGDVSAISKVCNVLLTPSAADAATRRWRALL